MSSRRNAIGSIRRGGRVFIREFCGGRMAFRGTGLHGGAGGEEEGAGGGPHAPLGVDNRFQQVKTGSRPAVAAHRSPGAGPGEFRLCSRTTGTGEVGKGRRTMRNSLSPVAFDGIGLCGWKSRPARFPRGTGRESLFRNLAHAND